MKNKLLEISATGGEKLLKLLARVPDRALAALLGVLERSIDTSPMPGGALHPVSELRLLASQDPEAMRIIREVLTGSRPGELTALLRGVLRHHLELGLPASALTLGNLLRPQRDPGVRSVGVCGVGRDMQKIADAYRELGCSVETWSSVTELTHSPRFHELEYLEYGDHDTPAEHLAQNLPSSLKALSLHHGVPCTATQLLDISAMATEAGAVLRLLYPLFHYEPLMELRRLLKQGEIGEVSTIRVRATAAGAGGALSPAPTGPGCFASHPAFDHSLLLSAIGGPIHSVTVYLNDPVDAQSPGAALVTCRFNRPCRYGLLECTAAPAMNIPSAGFPYDLEVELAGTDGIIWLNRGEARRTREAPLVIRAGKRSWRMGTGTGLRHDWDHTFINAASALLTCAANAALPGAVNQQALSALTLRASIYRAAAMGGVLQLPSG